VPFRRRVKRYGFRRMGSVGLHFQPVAVARNNVPKEQDMKKLMPRRGHGRPLIIGVSVLYFYGIA